MTDQLDCERCRKIQVAMDQGVPPHEARGANGWDECERDDCPMVPLPFGLGPIGGGGFGPGA
jgi:hypothetical protein